MELVVRVTKNDIVHCDMHSITDCAVAKAMQRAMNNSTVAVGVDRANWSQNTYPKYRGIKLPEIVASQITWLLMTPFGKLGRWLLGRPFSFTINVEPEDLNVG